MKKHLLFVMHYLEIGGAETALIGLLNAIDYSQFDVDLFLHSQRGEMLAYVPREVNLLPEIPLYAQIERPLRDVLKEGYFNMVAARIKAKVLTKLYQIKHPALNSVVEFQYIAKMVTPILPAINPTVEYDLAISFLQPHNIVRDKVRAKKKVCWIHTDYSSINVNTALELPIWESFDYVVSISEDVTRTFLQVFPSLANRVIKIENIISSSFVRKRANEFDAMPELVLCSGQSSGVKLLSVGRFTYAKNYDNIPAICSQIVSAGISDIKWFLIGFGPEERLIRERISEYGMEEHVIILGKKNNPYPYIKACDIYVQPSRFEGKSVSVLEAQMLFKPVIVTDYPTAKSQISDGIDGVIVPLDNQNCARGIMELLRDTRKQRRIIQFLQAHEYNNETGAEVLNSMV